MSRKKTHPLDEEFEVKEKIFMDDFDDGIDIPEDPELQDLALVIKLALVQYKDNCDTMHLVEPRNKIKYMEINASLLNTVKDAKFKMEKLKNERERYLKPTSRASGNDDSGSSKNEDESVSRDDLYSKVRRIK